MSDTYSQISIHAVYAVKFRESIIEKAWREELYKYTTGILKNEGVKVLAVEGWVDHVHLFFGLPVKLAISDLLQTVKANSSKWINENGFSKHKFQWQDGFGAFSYSKSQRDVVIKYILNQEVHHQKETFKTEYLKLLQNFDVDFNEKYLFDIFE